MSTRAKLFKWHNAVGLAATAFVLVVALTGVFLTFRGSFKTPRPKAPVVERHLSLERIIQAAEAAGDGSPATDISLPQSPEAPYLVWLDDDAETEVFLAGDGRVLETRSTAGGWMRFWFKLHTGEILGPLGLFVSLLTGLSLCLLAATGTWMWASRRKPKKKRTSESL